MLSSRWLCSRCLGPSLRTVASFRLPVRFQSTSSPSADAVPSPVLLQRARAIAAEHVALSAQNAQDYDVTIAKRIGELSPVASAVKEWEDTQNSLTELQTLLTDPSSDHELRALASADISTLTSLLPQLTHRLTNSLIPPHPFSHLPALVELHPGAGGSEASLFAHTLLQMYISLCTRLRLPHTVQSYTPDESLSTSTPGLTSAILEISSPSAYNLFRSEAGVHRVQRVPTTEKKGRTHTSAVSVLVLPSFPTTTTTTTTSSSSSDRSEIDFSDPQSDYFINPQDVRSETMKARGAGGQAVNKTDSAVRLTHFPTGVVVSMSESRSQLKNREMAWNLLRSKIAAKRREEREEEMLNLRRKVMGGVGKMGREDKVRTYNFSQNRVTDHRCGWEVGDLEGVLAGEGVLEEGMEMVRRWIDEREVEVMVAEEEARVKGEGMRNGGGES